MKLAVMAASPDVSLTVVDAAFASAMAADPVVTFHPAKSYPVAGDAEIFVSALWVTVTGEVEGRVIFPPAAGEATTESEYDFRVKFAAMAASPVVSFTVVEADVASVMVAEPEITVQPEKVYPVDAEAIIDVAAL